MRHIFGSMAFVLDGLLTVSNALPCLRVLWVTGTG